MMLMCFLPNQQQLKGMELAEQQRSHQNLKMIFEIDNVQTKVYLYNFASPLVDDSERAVF